MKDEYSIHFIYFRKYFYYTHHQQNNVGYIGFVISFVTGPEN